jgi:hypothetical protein
MGIKAFGNKPKGTIAEEIDEDENEEFIMDDEEDEIYLDEEVFVSTQPLPPVVTIPIAPPEHKPFVLSKPLVKPVNSQEDKKLETIQKPVVQPLQKPVVQQVINPDVDFHKGMKLDEFLRKNPTIRSEKDVLQYYSKEEAQYFIRHGKVYFKKGKFVV